MKVPVRGIAALLFLALLAAGMVQAARSFAAALERPRLYAYFDEALIKQAETLSAVTWQRETQPLDRPFEKSDAAAIGRKLTEGWAAHANALATGKTGYLADHFSGVALERAVASAQAEGARMVVLHQTARPAFYHKDGSVLQVQAQALTARFLLAGDDLAAFRLTTDSTVTTLLNEAAGWRVFSHERSAATGIEAPRPVVQMGPLVGVNYYPAASPWSRFWPEFDRETLRRDFALIRGMGGNALRIFLQREAFLDPVSTPRNLANLRILLAEADRAGLQVVPTLFDMRGGYEPGRWANDALWLKAVLPVLAAADNLAYVDLKNEADLDYARHGKGLVQAWLRSMIAVSRQIAPDMALTIGWSRADVAGDLVELVDVVSYHDYQPVDGTAARLAAVQGLAAGKPVQVTEVGASSWALALGMVPHSPASQARALQDRLAGLQGASGVFVWTLHDFPEPDAVAIGRSPWRRGLQAHFGLLAPDGTEKPAAAVVRAAFTRFLKEVVK